MHRQLFFFVFLSGGIVHFSTTQDLDLSDLKRKDAGYFLAYSRTLLAGRNETVCLILKEAVVPTKALLDLKIKDKHNTITKIMHSDHSCFELPVPKHNTTEVLTASLHLQIMLNGSITTSHNQDPILIYPDIDVTFLETDKSTYNQGDEIRMRILVLTQEIRPTTKIKAISYLKIVNPHGFTVAIWSNIMTDHGLAQLEYQLSDETVLGKWKVECNGVLKYFNVKRYVLPRFKVEITAPKNIYIDAQTVNLTVCSKYSFEKFVKGTVLIKISHAHIKNRSMTKLARVQNECALFNLNGNELKLNSEDPQMQLSKFNLNVVAIVTEDGTNQIETESATIAVKTMPYELKFAEENSYFQPGLAYRGKLKMFDVNIERLEEEYVQICYQLASKKTWNIKPEECGNFSFESDGTLLFHLLPFKENVVEIKLTAKSLNTTSDITANLSLKKWYSVSNSYIHISRNIKSPSKCKSTQQFTVYYTTNKIKPNENLTFFYMIKTRNSIVQMRKIHHMPRRGLLNFRQELANIVGKENKFVKAESLVDRFILKFRLHPSIISKSQLIVLYLTRDETVSNSIDIYVEKCLTNNVEAQWMDKSMYPGEYATLRINTTTNSLCAISAVDKSTTYMGNNKMLNVHSILQPLIQPAEMKMGNKLNCLTNQKKKIEPMFFERFDDLRRRRSVTMMMASEDYDSYEIFSSIGLSAMTNLRMISKPCNNPEVYYIKMDHPKEMSITSTLYEILNEDRGVTIRSYFPETWLWELIPTGKFGQTYFSRYLPHTITTWVTNVLCVSPTEGVGLSAKQELIVFQPFFIEVLVPYSIRRYEVLHLQVSVFNYLNYSLPIRITLEDVIGLELLDKKYGKRVTICVQSGEKHVHIFRVKGTTLGNVNVTVQAEIESSYPSECGPETIINKRDVVTKNLVIEPEGHFTEFSKSALLCDNGDINNITWDVDIPYETVEDSEKVKLTFNSDLMGPTLQNLEKFVNMPTGCGEQIMATMAPNLYVLRYLKATGKLTPNVRQRSIKNLKIGYQRILDYMHKDGSFSAFGYHDPAGSMFLTSFVVRTLQQTKEHTYVDEKVIKKSTDWILQHQLENGCFAAVSHVFQDMGGTSTENSTAALTAYVIISLLESNIHVPQSVKTNAKYCIRGQHNPDKYTLAISTYALYLLEWEQEADRYLGRLLEVATKDGKLMWWSNTGGSSSVNIEMTGYVLIALMHRFTNENLIHASSVVRWLGTQRNSNGGFITTQDTVVALDALSRYSTLMKNRDPELNLTILASKEKYRMDIQKGDSFKMKEIVLVTVPSELTISAAGQGCVLVQLSVGYNTLRMASSEAFTLAVDVHPVSTIDKCSVALITPCVSYKNIGHSNMAVLEVTMPSGYEPDRASLYKLIEEEHTKVKKFEEYENRVVVYFTELNKDPVCVPFNINENIIIEEQIEAVVKLYDYYNPEMTVFATYTVNKCQPNVIGLIPELKVANKNVQNVSNYTETLNSSQITKRDIKEKYRPKYGFNSDFIDMDVDMATPSGMEGNIPTYIKANTSNKH